MWCVFHTVLSCDCLLNLLMHKALKIHLGRWAMLEELFKHVYNFKHSHRLGFSVSLANRTFLIQLTENTKNIYTGTYSGCAEPLTYQDSYLEFSFAGVSFQMKSRNDQFTPVSITNLKYPIWMLPHLYNPLTRLGLKINGCPTDAHCHTSCLFVTCWT